MSSKQLNHYSVVADHPQVPPLTISQADVDEAYGDPSEGHSIMFYTDSDWSRKFERFFQEHIVWVKSNNVVRFFADCAAKKGLLSEQQKSGLKDIGSVLPLTPQKCG